MILLVGQYNAQILKELLKFGEPFQILEGEQRNKNSLVVNLQDASAVRLAVANLPCRPSLAFAMYEKYIPLCAQISEWLGIDSALSYNAALRCTDKILMRQALQSVGNISPHFTEVNSKDQAFAFAHTYGFPLVLKPANLSKSMLVTICKNMDTLKASLDISLTNAPSLYQKYTLGMRPKFIIEEFMAGSTHTIAGFVDRFGVTTFATGIVDNVSAREVGYDDSFIYCRQLPSMLPVHYQQQLYECASKGMVALGMRSCPAHVELILLPDGPRIIEIGARLGGYRQTLYNIGFGYDLFKAAMEAYRGQLPKFSRAVSPKACSVIELFPTHEGYFHSIKHINLINQLPSFKALSLNHDIGKFTGRSSQGYKASAVVTLCHDSYEQMQNDIRFIRKNVSIVLRKTQ